MMLESDRPRRRRINSGTGLPFVFSGRATSYARNWTSQAAREAGAIAIEDDDEPSDGLRAERHLAAESGRYNFAIPIPTCGERGVLVD
jgi:hypothetical protein